MGWNHQPVGKMFASFLSPWLPVPGLAHVGLKSILTGQPQSRDYADQSEQMVEMEGQQIMDLCWTIVKYMLYVEYEYM